MPTAKRPAPGAGSAWTWVTLCVDTKLVPGWRVGGRDGETGHAFLEDLVSRVSHRVQIARDGLDVCLDAVFKAFGSDVDFATLVKQFHATDGSVTQAKTHVTGRVHPSEVSTSLVERQSLTMRMSMRRFMRKTATRRTTSTPWRCTRWSTTSAGSTRRSG